MDHRPPDQDQDDQSHVEFEITDIDAEENGEARTRSNGSSTLTSVFEQFARHHRLWFAGAICLGCVMICLLLFPDVASFINPIVSPSETMTSTPSPNQAMAFSSKDNVTIVGDAQVEEGHSEGKGNQFVSMTAYDTQSGALLWRTPQPPSTNIIYSRVYNPQNQDYDVYAHRLDGLVSLFAPRTGKVLWNYKMPIMISSVFESDNIYFFQDVDDMMYAVKDGHLLWHTVTPVGDEWLVENGVMYIYNSRQQSYSALSTNSGKRFWTYVAPIPARLSAMGISSMMVENNTAYLQTVDNTLLAIQSQGHVLWTHRLDNAVSLKADAHHLYVIDPVANTLDIFNLQTGNIEQAYTNEAGANTILAVQDNLVYIQADEGVRVVNAETGKMVWRHQTTSVDQQALIETDSIFIIPLDGEGSMQILDKRDGAVRWSSTIKDLPVSFDNSVVDLLSSDYDTISVLRLSDGKILWHKSVLW